MSWSDHHTSSEKLASEAQASHRRGEREVAERLYSEAAEQETKALQYLPEDKQRTRGITAVSAVALWYKARAFARAEEVALRELAAGLLPGFAKRQVQELLQIVWSVRSADAAGVRFVPGDILVSVKGGQIIHGGAPLDLILHKVEGIQATLFRTVEFLLNRPFRSRGAPVADVQEMFRPWLFQAPAGSYQFAVRVQEPLQQGLWEAERPTVERVTATFLRVLRAAADDPSSGMSQVVENAEYRGAFLNLTRNLAPTGKTFERLEIRDASSPSEPVVSFAAESRKQLNAVLRERRAKREVRPADEAVTLTGVLRAVHLDQDWLEVSVLEPQPAHIRIEDAGDALDDVVGPMVNRRVVVETVRRAGKFHYRDIELDE